MRRNFSQSGMSLVTVLVALGISGILGTILMRQQDMMFKANKKAQNDSDRIALVNHFRSRISCSKALDYVKSQAVVCPAVIPIVDNDNKTLIGDGTGQGGAKGTVTTIGVWTARARCHDKGAFRGIDIQVAMPAKGNTDPLGNTGDFKLDPLTNAPRDWIGSRAEYVSQASLSPKESLPCSDEFGGAADGLARVDLECQNKAVKFYASGQAENYNDYNRRVTIDCPKTHPMAMSASVSPSCAALGDGNAVVVTKNSSPYPNSAVCSNGFWAPATHLSPDERQQRLSFCENQIAKGIYEDKGDADAATCRIVCCRSK